MVDKIFSTHVIGAELVLQLVCVTGDWLLQDESGRWLKALTDNLTHAAVGFVSWAIVVGVECSTKRLMEMTVCAMLAASVDVDHFITARSLSLSVS